jgi:hypothetical protein
MTYHFTHYSLHLKIPKHDKLSERNPTLPPRFEFISQAQGWINELRLQKIAGGITESKQLLLGILAKFQYTLLF